MCRVRCVLKRRSQKPERIDLSGGRALSVMGLLPYILGAVTFAAPVWYLAVLPNIGFGAVNATTSASAHVYAVPEVSTITVPPTQQQEEAEPQVARPQESRRPAAPTFLGGN
jgi:hypothetical protein